MPRICHPCCNLVGQPLIVCVLCMLIDSVFSLQLQIWLLKKDHTGNLNHQENIKGFFSWVGGGRQLVMRHILSGYVWIFLQENCKLVVAKMYYKRCVLERKSTSSGVFFRDFKQTMKKNTDLLVPPVPS